MYFSLDDLFLNLSYLKPNPEGIRRLGESTEVDIGGALGLAKTLHTDRFGRYRSGLG